MTLPGAHDTLLSTARAHAAAGTWAELRSLLAEQRDAVRAQPELAVLLAESLLRAEEPREALPLLDDALPLLDRNGDRGLLRRCVNLVGAARFVLGELDAAQRAFERALEMGRDDEDDLLVARATNNLALIANVRGRRDDALALYQLAIPAYQRLGDAQGLATSYHNMAISYRDMAISSRDAGKLEEADEAERRAIEYAHTVGDARLVAIARVGRAELSLHRGDAELAAAGAGHAARALAGIREPVGEANALLVAGKANVRLGRLAEAQTALDRALALAHDHGNALIKAEALCARAELAETTGALERAREDAAAALRIYVQLDAAEERDRLKAWLARLERRGDARAN